MICSYFGIAFLLLFMKMEFKITSLLLTPPRFGTDEMFSWLRNFFLKLTEFCLATPRKRYKRYWPENVHIVWQTYDGFKISVNSIIEVTQFLL